MNKPLLEQLITANAHQKQFPDLVCIGNGCPSDPLRYQLELSDEDHVYTTNGKGLDRNPYYSGDTPQFVYYVQESLLKAAPAPVKEIGVADMIDDIEAKISELEEKLAEAKAVHAALLTVQRYKAK